MIKFNRITSLENTEPVDLEEVSDSMAPTMPADYLEQHADQPAFDYESDPFSTLELEGEGE